MNAAFTLLGSYIDEQLRINTALSAYFIEPGTVKCIGGAAKTLLAESPTRITSRPARSRILAMVYEAIDIVKGRADISSLGKLLDKNWQIKKRLSRRISTPEIDNIYSSAMKAGAVGGKLLGAGGGGFILFFAEPKAHPRIKGKLKRYLNVPFRFENSGSQIIFHDREAI